MKFHPITIELFKERLRKILLWLIGLAVVAAALSPLIYSRYISDAPVTYTELNGVILEGPSRGVIGHQRKALFRVRLDNGVIVSASGIAKVPENYRGIVRVLEAHRESGGSMYEILGPHD